MSDKKARLQALMLDWRANQTLLQEAERTAESLKKAIAELVGDEDGLTLGSIAGMRYTAQWQTRDNRKLNYEKLTALVADGRVASLPAAYYKATLTDEAIEKLVEDRLIGPDDLESCLEGTRSRFIVVRATKEDDVTGVLVPPRAEL